MSRNIFAESKTALLARYGHLNDGLLSFGRCAVLLMLVLVVFAAVHELIPGVCAELYTASGRCGLCQIILSIVMFCYGLSYFLDNRVVIEFSYLSLLLISIGVLTSMQSRAPPVTLLP